MNFINVSGVPFNAIHANDSSYCDEVNHIVQYEPNEAFRPAMAMQMVGLGSHYAAAAATDANGKPLDGSQTCKIHLPPNIPAKDFWSFVVYDNQTRSLLQTDQQFPSIGSQKAGLVVNPDTIDTFPSNSHWTTLHPMQNYSSSSAHPVRVLVAYAIRRPFPS